jgi:cytochrome c oxidase subunit II
MSITPPSERIWIVIAFLWGLVMFFMMIFWHGYGQQNLSNEAYRIDATDYTKKTQAMVDQYTVRTVKTEHEEIPVVRPPAGSDVYLIARLWKWWPLLEFEKGKSYRLHISSLDWQHGFSLQPVNINLQIHPGYEMVVTVTPDKAGEYSIVCNEYCGIGHHLMIGKIYVVEEGGQP